MRTARLLTVFRSIPCIGKVYICGGGAASRGLGQTPWSCDL